MSLNPNAVPFVPPQQQLVVYNPQRRRRRRRRNRNNSNNNVQQQLQQVIQVSKKLDSQMNKMVSLTNQGNNNVPLLGTALPTQVPSLIVSPETSEDVRLKSTQESLTTLYRQLLRVLKSGVGSVIAHRDMIHVDVQFPTNQIAGGTVFLSGTPRSSSA